MSQAQPEPVEAAPNTNQAQKGKRQINFVLAVQLAIVVVLAFLIGERFTSLFHGASATIGALWCALTGISVLQKTRQETWKEGSSQVLGALIGAIISGIYLSFLPFSPLGMAISVGITVVVCHTSGFSGSSKLASASVVMVMVISSSNPSLNPLLNAALRFSEAIIGAGIAFLVAFASPTRKPDSQ